MSFLTKRERWHQRSPISVGDLVPRLFLVRENAFGHVPVVIQGFRDIGPCQVVMREVRDGWS
jgi:hypothetical protein